METYRPFSGYFTCEAVAALNPWEVARVVRFLPEPLSTEFHTMWTHALDIATRNKESEQLWARISEAEIEQELHDQEFPA
jgi:hypothetical protein